MKPTLLALAAASVAALAPAAQAQETARVISSIPMIQQVAVPRQVCTTQQVAVEQPKSGAGAALGAIAGGALGNQIGRGDGRTLATIAGVVGGAMLGNHVEGQPQARVQDQTTCSQQTVYENRTVGYEVTYEYAGRQYKVQSPQDPGPYLRVQVTPVLPAPTAAPVSPPPVAVPVRPISAVPSPWVLAAAPVYLPAPAWVGHPVHPGAWR
jgi:uncharacterized protein YcfJ